MAKKTTEKILGDISELYLSKWKDANGNLYYLDSPRSGEFVLRTYVPSVEPEPEPEPEPAAEE
jgi:hypothetical protein